MGRLRNCRCKLICDYSIKGHCKILQQQSFIYLKNGKGAITLTSVNAKTPYLLKFYNYTLIPGRIWSTPPSISTGQGSTAKLAIPFHLLISGERLWKSFSYA